MTQAVHPDLVTNLTAPAFVHCLRKFHSQEGHPISNVKMFKASKKILRRLYDNEEVRVHFETNQIDWRFNLEWALGGADFRPLDWNCETLP